MSRFDKVLRENPEDKRFSTVGCEKARSKYLGKTFKTNRFGDVEVIEYTNAYNILVEFSDGTVVSARTGDLIRGEVKNPNHPNYSGVGFIGQGRHSLRTVAGSKWKSMIKRSYSETYKELKPTYRDCTVDPKWHNFQNFADWASTQKGLKEGFFLDKDLLHLGNKVYGEEYCCFLPKEINACISVKKSKSRDYLPVGVVEVYGGKFKAQCYVSGRQEFSKVTDNMEEAFLWYKGKKEGIFKALAEEWRGAIEDRAYEALINLRVREDGLYDIRK